MIYNLKSIFESFQSRMKSELKDLSDEDAVKRKILNNTFDSIDIYGIDKIKNPVELINIFKKNINGNIYINDKILRKWHADFGTVNFEPYNEDNLYVTIDSEVGVKIVITIDNTNYEKFFYDQVFTEIIYNKKIYNVYPVFDFIKKPVDDYSATFSFIKLCNFITSSKFKEMISEGFDNLINKNPDYFYSLNIKVMFFMYYVIYVIQKAGFHFKINYNHDYFKDKVNIKEAVKKIMNKNGLRFE